MLALNNSFKRDPSFIIELEDPGVTFSTSSVVPVAMSAQLHFFGPYVYHPIVSLSKVKDLEFEFLDCFIEGWFKVQNEESIFKFCLCFDLNKIRANSKKPFAFSFNFNNQQNWL